MVKFFRKSGQEPLAVRMAGIKLADRLLVVGCSDPRLIAALALKTGLTGRACAIDESAERVAEAARAVEREGALVEIVQAPVDQSPYEDGSFDVVVIRDVLPRLDADTRARCVRDVHRVLRPGGRCVAIEGSVRRGLGAMLARGSVNEAYVAAGGAQRALEGEGFVAVRTLAEREGQVFVEGVKKGEG